MGFFYALIAFNINLFSMLWWNLMFEIAENGQIAVLNFFGILAIKLFLILGSVYITGFRLAASGSGVPQLRAVLSGIWIREYLSLPTLCVKIIAVHLSIASALPTGLEGPFLHISAGLSRQLSRLKLFQHLDRRQVIYIDITYMYIYIYTYICICLELKTTNSIIYPLFLFFFFLKKKKKKLLGAGCAGALGAVFGAPIGGVLFSIEVTSTYYPVTNYWTAFCCGISASTFIKVLYRSVSHVSMFQHFIGDNATKFSKEGHETYKSGELPLFLLLGFLFGLVGLFVVKCNAWFVLFRRKYQAKYLGTNPYGITVAVVILFSTFQFFVGQFALGPARSAVADLFIQTHLEACGGDTKVPCSYTDWGDSDLIWKLGGATIIWMVFLPLLQTFQFPAGVVGPSYILGAFGGRFYGEIVRSCLEKNGLGTADTRVYAVVGAAASLASVTKTISPAVIIMEITSELTLSVPLLLAVIVGCGVVSAFGEGFFDSGLKLRGIPMLPIVPSQQYKHATETTTLNRPEEKEMPSLALDEKKEEPKSFQYTVLRLITATDVMEKTMFITVKPNPLELVEALVHTKNEWFPLVHSKSENVLVGEVQRNVLMDFLQTVAPDIYEEKIPARLRDEHLPNLDNYPTNLTKLDTIGPTGSFNWKKRSKSLLTRKSKDKGSAKTTDIPPERLANTGDTPSSNKTSKKEAKRRKCSLMAGGFLERLHLAPFQVIAEMPLSKIYTLFHILKPQNVYVTKYSRLIGVITELHLLELEKQIQMTKDAQPLNKIDNANKKNISRLFAYNNLVFVLFFCCVFFSFFFLMCASQSFFVPLLQAKREQYFLNFYFSPFLKQDRYCQWELFFFACEEIYVQSILKNDKSKCSNVRPCLKPFNLGNHRTKKSSYWLRDAKKAHDFAHIKCNFGLYFVKKKTNKKGRLQTNGETLSLFSPSHTEPFSAATGQGREGQIETFKFEIKKWKNKYELACKHRREAEDRNAKNAIALEEWKSRAKSFELEHSHFTRRHDHEMKEIQLSNQRDFQRAKISYEQKIEELNNKLISNESLTRQLQKVNNEIQNELESYREKFLSNKTYQSSLENKLEMSMQRMMEVQQSLSEQMDDAQNTLRDEKNECVRELERVKVQLKVKTDDCTFLRSHLDSERTEQCKRINDLQAKHHTHVNKLMNEIDILRKENLQLQQQKDDFSRSTQQISDSLDNTVCSFAFKLVKDNNKKLPCTFRNSSITRHKYTFRYKLAVKFLCELELESTRLNEKLKAIIFELDHSRAEVHLLVCLAFVDDRKKDIESTKEQSSKSDIRVNQLTETIRIQEAELENYKEENTELRNQLPQLQALIQKLRLENTQLTVNNEALQEMNTQLKKDIEENRKNSICVSKLQEANDKTEKLSQELSECYKKIERLSLQLENTKADLTKLSTTTSQFVKNITKKRASKIGSENRVLGSHLNRVEKENEELRKQLSNLKSCVKENKSTQDLLRQQLKKYSKIKKSLDNLQCMADVNDELIHANQLLRQEMSELV
ncbi:CLC-type chloride cHannel family member (clh-4) [Reticulomyxa filosa]|uniref:CLC-type chloride cHannel family member (Clh-4) n=1 Tax=Reticulomyxa filosa TaxID=46433 RepID=X6P0R2_RETFI|nr:CLC-type chloride cHannel family member (clh-4) [Reticulomyxa filosa]|eukprot:ETO31811.1 CLC-type chloride cHannel family member (clh-4) [Reticulomyxa filosa]